MPDGSTTHRTAGRRTAGAPLDRDDAAALLTFLRAVLGQHSVASALTINDPHDMTTRATVEPSGGVSLSPRAVQRLIPLLARGDLYDSAVLIHALRVNTALPADAIADILAGARLDRVPGLAMAERIMRENG